jgi:hypothetical protein
MNADGGGDFDGGGVLGVLGADREHVHVFALQHFSEIGVGIDVQIRGESFRTFGRDVAHGYQFGVGQRLIGESVGSGDFAAAYDGSS